MAVVSELSEKSPSVKGIVFEGRYFLVDETSFRPKLLSAITQAFLDVIGQLEGSEAAAAVATHGLGQMHRFVPTEKVLKLQEGVRVRLRHMLYFWSYEVGRDHFGLDQPFFIDELIVIRVHYPFAVAQPTQTVEQPGRALSEVVDQVASTLRNPSLLGHQIARGVSWLGTRSALRARTIPPRAF